MKQVVVYLKLEQNVEVNVPEIYLKDLGSIYCEDSVLLVKAKSLKIIKMTHEEDKRCVLSVLKIIEMLKELYQGIDVVNLGSADVVIEWVQEKKKSIYGKWIKIGFVSLVCFFGTSFTIMSYHNDIGLNGLFAQYYEMITGEKSNGVTILELSYSIGLSVGILVFFNHIGRKRITKDPTPIEVQMCQYEMDVNTALIQTAGKGGKEIDVS